MGDHKFAKNVFFVCEAKTRTNSKKNDEDVWKNVRDNKQNFIKIYTHVMVIPKKGPKAE